MNLLLVSSERWFPEKAATAMSCLETYCEKMGAAT